MTSSGSMVTTAQAAEAFDMDSLLCRIPSVHSMRDIPYVSNSDNADSQAEIRHFAPDMPCSPAVPHLKDLEEPHHGPISRRASSPSTSSKTSGVFTDAPSSHGGRMQLKGESSDGPSDDTPSSCNPGTSLDDLKLLDTRCKQMSAHLVDLAERASNSVILATVYERFNASFSDALSHLANNDFQDTSAFMSTFYQVRDIHKQMQRMGPVGSVFPHSCDLSKLVKWDYRQLINSFLTLLRTSPGFIVSAYLELSPQYARLFVGKSAESADDIAAAQRLCPLGILFHGMIRDPVQRTNYFAAMCAQLIIEASDDSLCKAVFAKFTEPCSLFTSSTIKRLDRLLRKVIAKSQAQGALSNASARSLDSPDLGLSDEVWAEACQDLEHLLRSSELICPEFGKFVATLRSLASGAAYHIDAIALSHYRARIKQVLINPQRYGSLMDVYINESTVKRVLLPLSQHFTEFLKHSTDLTDLILQRNMNVQHNEQYFEPGQLMVISLGDIVFMFHALFPSSAAGKAASSILPQSPPSQSTKSGRPRVDSIGTSISDDENEWCLDNIQADLEPVMKELALKLPHLRGRFMRHHQPGLFADYWQIFKIEGEGLVNDLEKNCWVQHSKNLDALSSAISWRKPGESWNEVIRCAISNAEQGGDFLSAHCLQRYCSMPEVLVAKDIRAEFDNLAENLADQQSALEDIAARYSAQCSALRQDAKQLMSLLNLARLRIWYEQEVRTTSLWQRANDVVGLLRGELALQRANSGSSVSSLQRRFSTRNRRLSILSAHSLGDSFFVSKEYLPKPKLADREVDVTLNYFQRNQVRNFCQCEELLHRFNAEITSLLAKILDRDFLHGGSTLYKRDTRRESTNLAAHRVSMSVLPDLRSQGRGQHKSSSSLADIYESKGRDAGQHDTEFGAEITPGDGIVLPCQQTLCGLLLSDIGGEYLARGSDTDEYMQQTGQMLLDGDGSVLQGVLNDISLQTSPLAKIRGFEQLVKLVTVRLECRQGAKASHAEVSYELTKLICREPGTMFRDLQLVAGLAPVSVLENAEQSQAFWDVADAAVRVLDQVVTKSMDLATRMLRYHNETAAATTAVANMGVSDAVAIWSFCARVGRPQAQRKLAQLYLEYTHTLLDVMPFSRPGIIFEGIDLPHARQAVVGHWMQQAAQQGDIEALDYCHKQQNAGFI